MLVFHSFPDRHSARAFAVSVRDNFQRTTTLCLNRDSLGQASWLPEELGMPIVLIERSDKIKVEIEVETQTEDSSTLLIRTLVPGCEVKAARALVEMAASFGGAFAGSPGLNLNPGGA